MPLRAKGRHYTLQALKERAGVSQACRRKANFDMPPSKSKNTDQPESPCLAKTVLHKQTDDILHSKKRFSYHKRVKTFKAGNIPKH